MAIDRNKLMGLIEQIDEIFELIPGSKEVKNHLRNTVIGPALDEIRKMAIESRAPVMLIFGRSGHGKSSLINALSNQMILDTTDEIRPNTAEAEEYLIDFPGKYSSWKIIDTRGIFESCRPANRDDNANDALLNAIKEYRPDVLMHVIAARDCRNIGPDLDFYREMTTRFKKEGMIMPTVVCITQVDTVNPPNEWPLKTGSQKSSTIVGHMKFLTTDVLKVETSKYDLNSELKGLRIEPSVENPYVGIFPVCTYWTNDEDHRWNIETLQRFIGENLPEAARLDFFQALGLRDLLKQMSSEIIERFSLISAGVGASPIPFSDIALLVPLQMLLIAIIGGLSCKPVSIDTAKEYMVASGVNMVGGFASKQLARQLLKFLPGFGTAISAGVASAGTYALGKAAETYFFNGEIVEPAKYDKENNG